MKLKYILGILLLSITFNQINAQDSSKVLQSVASTYVLDQYYKLNLKVFQADSTPEDVDNIFELFTNDFTYVHPQYGGVYTREDLYNGYMRNQKNGGYDGSVVDIQVENKIVGLNAIAVSKRFIKKEDGKIVAGEAQMALFEFKKGKIFRIYEYW
ncbi:nuclear transport factor 2 family protein [Flagellimonas sp.]|uniref:nuclear transport factor 2 family protein n=1 Tax=Flagellimonas sp. TaxID=2058762 RepID=UPI003BAD20E4